MRTRFLVPAALLLQGCLLHRGPVQPEPARGPARDSLFHLDAARGDSVAARGNVDGVLALLSTDVAYLRAGVPAAYGRDAVRVLLRASAPGKPEVREWQPLGGGVSDDLLMAYTFGLATRAPRDSATEFDPYIAVWKRARGQAWKIVAYSDIGSAPVRLGEDALTLAQITPPFGPTPQRIVEGRAALRVADSLFSDLSYRMGMAFAFSNTVAPYGAVFGDPSLVVGPAAVMDYLGPRGEGTSLTWTPVYADIAASGDLGYTVGEYIATGRGPSGAAVQRFGKYLTVWKKQPDGTWKFLIDGGSPSPKKAGN
jgi:hypothetical protein